MSRFAPFSDFELGEIWYAVTRDECGWAIKFKEGEPLYPLVRELFDEADRRGLVRRDLGPIDRHYWEDVLA